MCSLSWSRKGFHLLSASTDNTVCTFRLTVFILNLLRARLVLILNFLNEGIWNVVTGDCVKKYRFPSPFLKAQFNPRNSAEFLVCLLKHPSLLVSQDGSYYELPLDDPSEPNVISTFDRRGDHIFCGNGKGKVTMNKIIIEIRFFSWNY